MASREVILAATDADRREWRTITEQPRQLAIAADAELRPRHPGQHLEPLRSAEPEPITATELANLGLPVAGEAADATHWLPDLTAEHGAFADRLSNYEPQAARTERALSPAAWQIETPWLDAILQPPKPTIRNTARSRQLTVRTDYQLEAT